MSTQPDTDTVLAGLKDFQRATVDYVFERFYGPDPTKRFLVADEVGLGKTLVARGVMARTIDHLWKSVPRIDYALFEPPLERRIVVAGTMLVRETILGPANQGNGSAFGALRDEYDLRGCRPRRSALNGCDLAELNRRRFVQNGLADRVRVDGAGRKIVYLLIDFPHHMARERTQMQVQRQQRNDRSRRLRIAGHASLKCRPENRARLRHVGDDPLHHVDVAKPAVIGVVGADPALAVAVVEQAE